MPKAYWIAHVDTSDLDEYAKYVVASAAAYRKYKAVSLARGGRFEVLEGAGRTRNVIWEFESYQDALDCYHSPEYQAARAYRADISSGDFIILEGLADGPMPA